MASLDGTVKLDGSVLLSPSGFDVARAQAGSAPPHPLAGKWGSAANVGAQFVVNRTVGVDCGAGAVEQKAGDFLRLGGGLGQMAVVGAASVGAGLISGGIASVGVGLVTEAGTQAVLNRTGGDCAAVPQVPATAAAVAAVPAATAAIVVSGAGGLTDAQQAELDLILAKCADLQESASVELEGRFGPWASNPLFWVNFFSSPSAEETGAASQLAAVAVSTREVGESTLHWLSRVAPDWNWHVGGATWAGSPNHEGPDFIYGHNFVGGYDTGTYFKPQVACWPWDGWSGLEDVRGWRADFAKFYKFSAGGSPEVFWSVLGYMADFMSASGTVGAGVTAPPVTT